MKITKKSCIAFVCRYHNGACACFVFYSHTVTCVFVFFIKTHNAPIEVTFLAPENTTTLYLLSLVWNGNKVCELNLASGFVTKDWRSQLLLCRHTRLSWREERFVVCTQHPCWKKKYCLPLTVPHFLSSAWYTHPQTIPGSKLPPNLYLTEWK